MKVFIPLKFYPYEGNDDPQIAFKDEIAAWEWTREKKQQRYLSGAEWKVFEVELKEI